MLRGSIELRRHDGSSDVKFHERRDSNERKEKGRRQVGKERGTVIKGFKRPSFFTHLTQRRWIG